MLINNGIKIDGTSITDFVGYQAVNWQKVDSEGANAGMTLSGLTIRDRIASKVRLDITCRPLSGADLRSLLTLLSPEFVSVTYEDPLEGLVTKSMYTNTNEASILFAKPSYSTEYWANIAFQLIER